MLRRKPLKRKANLKTRKPIPKKNKKRADANYARAYGSKARVAFVKTLACVVCGTAPSDNAHIHGGKSGMARKGPYTDIIPLCRQCHTLYDEYKLKLDPAGLRLVADALEMYCSSTLPRRKEAA